MPGWAWWALGWFLVIVLVCVGWYVFRAPVREQEDLFHDSEDWDER